jgi:hypothetical protein
MRPRTRVLWLPRPRRSPTSGAVGNCDSWGLFCGGFSGCAELCVLGGRSRIGGLSPLQAVLKRFPAGSGASLVGFPSPMFRLSRSCRERGRDVGRHGAPIQYQVAQLGSRGLYQRRDPDIHRDLGGGPECGSGDHARPRLGPAVVVLLTFHAGDGDYCALGGDSGRRSGHRRRARGHREWSPAGPETATRPCAGGRRRAHSAPTGRILRRARLRHLWPQRGHRPQSLRDDSRGTAPRR